MKGLVKIHQRALAFDWIFKNAFIETGKSIVKVSKSIN